MPTPHDQVFALLRERIPAEALARVPRKWEKVGDVVVLRLAPELDSHKREVADAFARVLGARCVLEDRAGVGGELREMTARVLFGTDPVTTHVENGIRFRFDASRIMFSSGNVDERTRIAREDAKGETIADMFAGIGYFTLPLAKHAGAARVVAMEKNPLSYRYLVENVRLNGVEARVEPWPGDNREYPREGFADRVHMGYFPGTDKFLPKAFRLLKPEGGRIHYHETCPLEDVRDGALFRRVQEAARAHGLDAALVEARRAKNYAPGIVHAVAVVDVRPRRGANEP